MEHSEDWRYESSALRADGKITGYTYRDGGRGKNPQRYAGYFADVTFLISAGPVTITTDRRFELPEQGQAMFGWEVDVLYFPGTTQRARVLQWWQRRWPEILLVLLFPLAAILCVLHLLYQWWWPLEKRASNG